MFRGLGVQAFLGLRDFWGFLGVGGLKLRQKVASVSSFAQEGFGLGFGVCLGLGTNVRV